MTPLAWGRKVAAAFLHRLRAIDDQRARDQQTAIDTANDI